MKSKLKPLLEWIILTVCALTAGLGLAWLPLEKSVKEIEILVLGSAFLVWTVYVATVAYQSMWSDVNVWQDEEISASLEVQR
jgi:hypothetical protein